MPHFFWTGASPRAIYLIAILLDGAIKSTALLLAASLAAWLLRRGSAAQRHLVWLSAIVGMLLMPVLSAALPAWHILPQWVALAPKPAAVVADAPAALTPSPLPTPVHSPPIEPPSPMPAISPNPSPQPALPPSPLAVTPVVSTPLRLDLPIALLSLWLAGTLIALCPLLLALWSLRKLRRQSSPVQGSAWAQLMASLHSALGIRQRVTLLQSARCPVPMAFGIFRPAILLPADADTWPAERRRAVLLHELAHIKRHDCLAHLLVQFVRAIYWFHPLPWLAAARVHAECERACDDVVLTAGTKSSLYAATLMDYATAGRIGGRVSAAVMAMARPSTLEGRLLAILDGARNRRNLTRMGVLAVSALLVLVITPLACMHATQAAHAEQAQITGLVVASDGQPVQNAQIELRVDGADGNSTTDSTAPSGTGGTFALPLKNPTAAKGQVYAFVPGAGISLPILLPTEGSPRLTLMPAVDVHITLLAPDGKPAPRIAIRTVQVIFRADTGFDKYLQLPEAASQSFSGITGANGSCIIHGLPRRALVRFAVDDERFAQLSVLDDTSLTGGGSVIDVKPIQLKKAASISGTLVNPETHKPIAGMEIDAQAFDSNSDGAGGTALSDAQGRYVINRMRPGSYVVSMDYRDDERNEWAAAALDLALTEGEHSTANLIFTRGGFLKGQVRDAATGKPLTGATVGLYGSGRPERAGAIYERTTDAEGRYSFRVPPGMQHPYIAGDIDGYLINSNTDVQNVQVEDGQNVEADFNIQPDPTPIIAGIVLGPDGKPVAGATVTTVPNGMNEIYGTKWVQSDNQGRFHIRAESGTMLRARRKDLATITPVPAPVKGVPVELRLQPKSTFTLTVCLVDEKGRPVTNAAASLTRWSSDHGLSFSPSHADAEGKVRFEKLDLDTKYSVSAEGEGYGVSQNNVENPPADGAREAAVTLVLHSLTAQIAGVVVDENGKPVPGVMVGINGGETGFKETKTDAAGRFSFHVVAGASAAVFLRADDPISPIGVGAVAGNTDLRLVYRKPQGDPAATQPTAQPGSPAARAYLDRIKALLPKGWSATAEGDVITITRKQEARGLSLALNGPDLLPGQDPYKFFSMEIMLSVQPRITSEQRQAWVNQNDAATKKWYAEGGNRHRKSPLINDQLPTHFDDSHSIRLTCWELYPALFKFKDQNDAKECQQVFDAIAGLFHPYENPSPATQPAATEPAAAPATRSTLPLVNTEFNSPLALNVYVRGPSDTEFVLLGATPAAQALKIPPDNDWVVAPVGDTTTAMLADAIRNGTISRVRLPSANDGDLAPLAGLAGLRELVLNRTNITDAGLPYLKDLSGLEILNLEETKITAAGIENLKGLTSLRVLDISFTKVGDAALASVRKMTALQELDIADINLTDAGLVQLDGLTHLQKLDISLSKLTDVGLRHLQPLPELRELDLLAAQVTDAGWAQLESLAALQKLNLILTNITDAGLAHLKNMRDLRDLNLTSTDITDAGIKQLAGLTNLQALALAATHVTDAGVQQLASLKNLQRLALDNDPPITDASLHVIGGLDKLVDLGLSGTKITDAGMADIKNLAKLQKLTLGDTQISDAGLADIAGLTELRQLSLRGANVTDAGLAHLKNLAMLRNLDLDKTKVSDAGMQYIQGMAALNSLDLSETQISDAGLGQLKNLRALRYLRLFDMHITGEGLPDLAGFKDLQTLSFYGSPITDAALDHLKNMRGLQYLDLSLSHVTDAGLVRLNGLTNLQTLALGGTKITDAGLANLAGLNALQSLDLEDTHLTDAALIQIKNLPSLRDLDIARTNLTGATLGQLKSLPALQGLLLNGTKLTDAGFAQLVDLKSLQHLQLSFSTVTDAQALQLKNLTGLQQLALFGTKLDKATVQALRAALPNCTIYQTAPKEAASMSTPDGTGHVGAAAAIENGAAQWGPPTDGLRCCWIPPDGSITLGTRPEITVEIENAGKEQIFWQCSSQVTWMVSVAGVTPSGSMIMPKFTIATGDGTRLATEGEVRAKFGIAPQFPKGDSTPMPGFYALSPGGTLRLHAAVPEDFPKPGRYQLDCQLARLNLMTNVDYPAEKGIIACPPMVVSVMAKGAATVPTEDPTHWSAGEWGPVNAGMQVRLNPEKTFLNPGASTPGLFIDARNTGIRAMHLIIDRQHITIEVDGIMYYLQQKPEASVAPPRAFGPGNRWEGLPFDQFNAADYQDSHGNPLAFGPGKHTVRLILTADPDDPNAPIGTPYHLQTNAMQLPSADQLPYWNPAAATRPGAAATPP